MRRTRHPTILFREPNENHWIFPSPARYHYIYPYKNTHFYTTTRFHRIHTEAASARETWYTFSDAMCGLYAVESNIKCNISSHALLHTRCTIVYSAADAIYIYMSVCVCSGEARVSRGALCSDVSWYLFRMASEWACANLFILGTPTASIRVGAQQTYHVVHNGGAYLSMSVHIIHKLSECYADRWSILY